MGRPQNPLDPDAGPVEAFAYELRRLREKVGNPSYRKLAEQAHYSAAALARAAGGQALPTLELTLAYVAACGGDVEEWRQRWLDVAGRQDAPAPGPEAAESPSAATEAGAEADIEDGAGDGAEDVPVGRGPVRGSRKQGSRVRGMWIAAGVVLLLTAAGVLALVLWPRAAPAMAWSPARKVLPYTFEQGQSKVDGADPARAGCIEAVTLTSQEIWSGPQRLGNLEVRYSAGCGKAWARLDPNAALINHHSDDIRVRLETFRPADGSASRIDEEFVRDRHWAGMLSTRVGCVVARGQIVIDGQASDTVQTSCAHP